MKQEFNGAEYEKGSDVWFKDVLLQTDEVFRSFV